MVLRIQLLRGAVPPQGKHDPPAGGRTYLPQADHVKMDIFLF